MWTSTSSAISQEVEIQKLAKSTKWIRLMHYDVRQGQYKSRLDGRDFFFAKDGHINPVGELKATILGLKENREVGRLKLHPQCAFPERMQFIEENALMKYEKVSCPKFDNFMKRFRNPQGMSLVFSSAYPNNPASMFGHTFLKINSSRKSDLLDMGINFAAWTPKDINMLVFMFKGVVGGYPGLWSVEPYYKKVNEYINAESRDLWEYELNITADETKRILAHLWELEVTSYFDYYFFDENCAYQILKAIEAIKLDWNITQHNIYVIPGETVKNVFYQKGAIRNFKFRPSLFHQAQIKLSALNEKQKDSTLKLMNKIEDNSTDPKVISAALTGLMYYKAKKKKSWSAVDQLWENQLLKRQSELESSKTQLEIPNYLLKTNPKWAHDPYTVFMGMGHSRSKFYTDALVSSFKIRSSYHDLLASDKGLAPFTEIEFPWIEFEHNNETSKFDIKEIGGFSTTSLFPLTLLDQRKSWRVELGMKRENIYPCVNCFRPVIEAGIGAAIGDLDYRLYSLALGLIDFHPELELGYRARPGLELGYIISPFEKYKAKFIYQYLYNPVNTVVTNSFGVDQSYHYKRNREIRLTHQSKQSTHEVGNIYQETSLNYLFYFR